MLYKLERGVCIERRDQMKNNYKQIISVWNTIDRIKLSNIILMTPYYNINYREIAIDAIKNEIVKRTIISILNIR